MAGEKSIVMSEQQRAVFCLTLMAVTYGHSRQPADAELLQRLQRADQPPPIRGARVVENTEPNVLFAYTPHDGLLFNDDDGVADYFAADDDEAYSNGGFDAVPALSEAIVSLPEMAVGCGCGGGGEAREKECGVCLEGFEEGDKLRKMPCEHYFHESCVFKWLQGPSYVPHGVESAYIHINRDIEEDDDTYSDDGFCAVPASSDAIAALPVPETTVSETETREEEACAVCLEGFKEGDRVKKMPCSHDFHANCISEWLRVSRLCPHCHFALPAERDSEQKNPEEA
uniref:RING-type domain-containing protein n=1 Tax=Oryza glumipatula TaxID=40148 RepID=A0A0E0BF63_9ORYZ